MCIRLTTGIGGRGRLRWNRSRRVRRGFCARLRALRAELGHRRRHRCVDLIERLQARLKYAHVALGDLLLEDIIQRPGMPELILLLMSFRSTSKEASRAGLRSLT